MVRIEQLDTQTALAPARPATHPDHAPAAAAAAAAAAGPMLVAVCLLGVAVWFDGAFALRSWGPLAVFVLVALAAAGRNGVRGWPLTAVAALFAAAAWTGLSALWSPDPAAAVESGARAALYAALLALPVVTLPDRRWAVRTSGLLVAGLGGLVLLTFAACALMGVDAFLAGRLEDPVEYRNGTAALMALAAWPLLCVAARHRSHPLVRCAAFATATLAVGLAFLTQSRGLVLGLACGAAVALLLGPDRLRRAWLAVLAVAIIAVASPALLEPYDRFVASGTTDAAAIDTALRALAVAGAVAFAAGLAVALLDDGLRMSAQRRRAARGVAAGALVLLVVAAAGAALVSVGNPATYASAKLDEFRDVDGAVTGSTRLSSAGGQRYDLWRIAVDQFRDAPVAGAGAGGYAPEYYARRATDRNLSDPHSLPLRTLAETGLVGAVLLGAALLAAAIALARAWPGADPAQRRWASALAAGAAVVLGQSAVDWLWLIPGLTGLAFVALGLAVAVVATPAAPPPRRRRAGAVAGRVLPLAAAVLVAALFASDVYARAGRAATAPGDRLAAARTARDLNPLSLPPSHLEASALETLGRREQARGILLDALERQPRSFVTLGLLGDLETRAGDEAAARRYYRRALALNPRDTGLQKLAR